MHFDASHLLRPEMIFNVMTLIRPTQLFTVIVDSLAPAKISLKFKFRSTLRNVLCIYCDMQLRYSLYWRSLYLQHPCDTRNHQLD